MNINNVKEQIRKDRTALLPTLMLKRQPAEDGTPTPWLSHWDNDNRIRIVFHEEVAQQIAKEPNRVDIAMKYELVPATETRAAYHRYVVILPANIEHTF